MDKGGLPYEFEQAADYSVLALKPAMNSAEWSDIEQTGDAVLGELDAAGTPHLIVDLSELDYIGSAMVALLVRFWKVVKAKNARMVVVIRDPMVLEVLQIAKLDQVWEIAEYREDALHELGLSPEAKSERRESNVLVMASVVPALIAAVVLGIALAHPGVLGKTLAQILAYGCSGLGLVLGILLAVKAGGGRRLLGIAAAALSLAVLVGAFLWLPLTSEAAKPADKPAPKQTGGNSQSDKSSAKANNDSPVEPTSKPEAPQPAVAEKPGERE